MHRSGMLWPTLAALCGIILLLGLGTWQMQRLQWKEGLIAHIGERVHAAPVPIEPVLAEANQGADVEYTHITAHGRFQHDQERYLYATGEGDWGWDVITPLRLADGRMVLVNRGYVPRQLMDRSLRAGGLPEGEVTITGLIRAAPPGRPWFVPAANASKHTWSWLELADIAGSIPPSGGQVLTSIYVDADATHEQVPPAGGATRLELPNRHLEYAITWYALAATLAVIYGVFAIGRWRRRIG